MKMKSKLLSISLLVLVTMLSSLTINLGGISSSIPTAEAGYGSIDIITPNGNEHVSIGSTSRIQWTMSGTLGFYGNSEVWLMKGSSFAHLIKDRYTTSGNITYWTIPTSIQTGSDYKVRVISTDYPEVFDESDNSFTIFDANIMPNDSDGSSDYLSSNHQIIAGNISRSNYPDLFIAGVGEGIYRVDMANSQRYIYGQNRNSISPIEINSSYDTVYDYCDGNENQLAEAFVSNGMIESIGISLTGTPYKCVNGALTERDISLPTDSDNSPNYVNHPIYTANISRTNTPELFVAGFGQGTYAGSSHSNGWNIYGQEPNPLTPKSINSTFDTFYDHCANENQLNEAFIQSDNKIGALGVNVENSPYKCVGGALVERNPSPIVRIVVPNGWENFTAGVTIKVTFINQETQTTNITITNRNGTDYSSGWIDNPNNTYLQAVYIYVPTGAPAGNYYVEELAIDRNSTQTNKGNDTSDNYIRITKNQNIPEGAIIQAIGDNDVYIVKYKNGKQFKRLILSPSVFTSYGHLKWEDLIKVDKATLNKYTTSNLVRSAQGGRMYLLSPNGDSGERRYISGMNAFNRMGYDIDSVYEINETDEYSYYRNLSRDIY